jgi:hypothetical protein
MEWTHPGFCGGYPEAIGRRWMAHAVSRSYLAQWPCSRLIGQVARAVTLANDGVLGS